MLNPVTKPTPVELKVVAGVKLPDEINKSIDLTDNALLFYIEHTLGYPESVREPLSLINGLTGKSLTAIEVDVTGKPVSNPSQNISPLESKFYRIK